MCCYVNLKATDQRSWMTLFISRKTLQIHLVLQDPKSHWDQLRERFRKWFPFAHCSHLQSVWRAFISNSCCLPVPVSRYESPCPDHDKLSVSGAPVSIPQMETGVKSSPLSSRHILPDAAVGRKHRQASDEEVANLRSQTSAVSSSAAPFIRCSLFVPLI